MSRTRIAIGEAEDVVEEAAGILGIAPGVRSAQDGHGAPLLEHVADGVGELGRLREGADEEDVHVERQAPPAGPRTRYSTRGSRHVPPAHTRPR